MPPRGDVETFVKVVRTAEEGGFRSVWLYDAPRRWMDPYPLLGVIAAATRTLHFGVCVTNPVTRTLSTTAMAFATLQSVSGGRAELGIGRGDEGVHLPGCRPATLEELRDSIERLRDEMQKVDPSWRCEEPVPVWVAASGPRALRLAGAVADGVIMQFADVELLSWAKQFVSEGARNSGREPKRVRLMACAAEAVDLSPTDALERTRWFARMIACDIAPLIDKHRTSFSADLVDWADSWKAAGEDVRPQVADRVALRLALAGTAAACRLRLTAMEELGIEEVNLLSGSGELNVIERLARTLLSVKS